MLAKLNLASEQEIVDAYARILILAKQVGSIRPLTGPEMKELLDLKAKFGIKDARVEGGFEKFSCGQRHLIYCVI